MNVNLGSNRNANTTHINDFERGKSSNKSEEKLNKKRILKINVKRDNIQRFNNNTGINGVV